MRLKEVFEKAEANGLKAAVNHGKMKFVACRCGIKGPLFTRRMIGYVGCTECKAFVCLTKKRK